MRSLEEVRGQFRVRLAEAGLAEFTDDFLSVARPALIFRPCAAAFERDISLYFRPLGPANEDDIPVGCSKIGGWPDMPRSRRWPSPTAAFVLQIDLAKLPDVLDLDLPRQGLLTLFVDPDDVKLASLDWYVPEAGRLSRREPPEEARLFLPRRLDCDLTLTLDMNRQDAPIHDDRQDDIFAAFAVSQDEDFIQLGGDPHVLSSMLDELAERSDHAGLSELEAQWRLILQVGSIDEAEVGWGQGSLYVWMRAGDIRERRFENAVALVHAW